MPKRKTHEEFVEEMKIVNPNIEIIGLYQTTMTKIECKCLVCNNNWFVRPNNLLNKKGCPKCKANKAGDKNRKTQSEFISEIEKKNPYVKILGKYINNQTPIKCQCKICNHIWEGTIPSNLLKHHSCPNCRSVKASERESLGLDEYKKRLKDNQIQQIPLEDYKNNSTPILHRCNLCGTERKYAPSYLLREKKCIICQGSGIVAQYGINSLADTHPEIAEMIIDTKIPKHITCKSSLRTNFKCNICGTIVKNKEVRYVIEHGLSCQKCSDGISYPMKFVCNVLEQLNVDYKTEVVFENWDFLFHGRKYKPRYDIVFDNNIIEVDGGFHKRSNPKSKLTLDDIVFIDSEKDRLANENAFNLIRINAYESEIEYMKNSVLSSYLSTMYDLSNINWDECHKNSLKSYVKDVCDIWNNTTNPSVGKIRTISGYKECSIRRWLKQGAKIGLCNYDPIKQMKLNKGYENHGKKVICLNNLQVFDKIINGAKYYDIESASIIRSCKNRDFSGGKDKETKMPLYWMYYEDYLKEREVI